MARIAGYSKDDSSKIIVIREDTWAVETTQDITFGSYEITGLVSGKKSVLAVSSEGEVIGYGNVDAV